MNNSPTEIELFKTQYKSILHKSNEALIIESNGHKLESYSLFKSIINDIDIVLATTNTNSTQSEIQEKLIQLQTIRDNICDCMSRIQSDNNSISSDRLNTAKLVFSIGSECQYTRIDSRGTFGVPSYPGSLEIYELPSVVEGNKRGFIAVSDWIGDLCLGGDNQTPVLLTREGALMFLDSFVDCAQGKVAVTLPFEVSKEEFVRCVCVLSTLALLLVDEEQQETEEEQKKAGAQVGPQSVDTAMTVRTKGEIIADELNRDFQYVSKGVVGGAKKLGELVSKGSNELCLRLNPGEATLHPNIKTGLEYARFGTHKIVQVSGKAVGVLAKATQYVASKAAPYIVSTANNYIPNEWKEKGKNGEISKVDQVALVTGSGLHGLILLFDSLHEGAVTFGRSATRSCGRIMRHRYGEEIGRSTENALYSAGNLGLVAMAAHQFTKKGILKTAAKVTAVEVTDKYRRKSNNDAIQPLCQSNVADSNKHI